MLVYCSTQHPSEVQHLVARFEKYPDVAVTVEVRRMGGAFGGQETQPRNGLQSRRLVRASPAGPCKDPSRSR